jgi:hypothetical protein
MVMMEQAEIRFCTKTPADIHFDAGSPVVSLKHLFAFFG